MLNDLLEEEYTTESILIAKFILDGILNDPDIFTRGK